MGFLPEMGSTNPRSEKPLKFFEFCGEEALKTKIQHQGMESNLGFEGIWEGLRDESFRWNFEEERKGDRRLKVRGEREKVK